MRVAFEDAEGDQLGAGQHLLEGVGDGVEDERVEGPVRLPRVGTMTELPSWIPTVIAHLLGRLQIGL